MPARSWFAVLLAASALPAPADEPAGETLPPGARARLGSPRYRYSPNYVPAVTPDGKTIFAYDLAGLRRFDLAGADLGPAPAVPGISFEPPTAFSADGSRAVSVSTKTVVWEVASGKALSTVPRTIHYFDRGLALAALSADGKVLVFGATNRDGKGPLEVLVWDVDGGKEVARIRPPHNEQALVAVSPDGKTVATWGKHAAPAGKADPAAGEPGRTVYFWEADTGKPLSQVRATGFGPAAVAFAPDGSAAAVGGTSAIELVDPKTGASKQLLLGRSGVGKALAFSPDGSTLFAAADAGLVQRWRTADGARLSATDPPAPSLYSCQVQAVAPDRGVAWAVRSGALVVWEVPSGKRPGPADGHFAPVSRVTVTPDGRSVLTAGNDAQVLRWDLATGKRAGPVAGRTGAGFGQAELSPGGGRLLVSDLGGFAVLDGATGQPEYVIPTGGSNVQRASFSPDGTKAVTVQGAYDGKGEPAVVTVWDVATARRVCAVRLPGFTPGDAALTPDGKHLLTAARKPAEKGAGEFVVTAWRVPGGEKAGEFREEAGFGAGLVAAAGDNATAAVLTSKSKLVRFELATGNTAPVPGWSDSLAAAPVFGPGGQVALLGPTAFGRPAPVAVLDWETGKPAHTFTCPDGGATAAAFTPDGKTLVTGTSKGTALVWDLGK